MKNGHSYKLIANFKLKTDADSARKICFELCNLLETTFPLKSSGCQYDKSGTADCFWGSGHIKGCRYVGGVALTLSSFNLRNAIFQYFQVVASTDNKKHLPKIEKYKEFCLDFLIHNGMEKIEL